MSLKIGYYGYMAPDAGCSDIFRFICMTAGSDPDAGKREAGDQSRNTSSEPEALPCAEGTVRWGDWSNIDTVEPTIWSHGGDMREAWWQEAHQSVRSARSPKRSQAGGM